MNDIPKAPFTLQEAAPNSAGYGVDGSGTAILDANKVHVFTSENPNNALWLVDTLNCAMAHKPFLCGGNHCMGRGDMACPGCVGADNPALKPTPEAAFEDYNGAPWDTAQCDWDHFLAGWNAAKATLEAHIRHALNLLTQETYDHSTIPDAIDTLQYAIGDKQ